MANGIVDSINPPKVHGIIRETTTFVEYHFVMPNSVKPGDPTLLLEVGDRVTFIPDKNFATQVKRAEPPSCSLTANPNSILPTESTTLDWITTNADSASIDQGVGAVSVPSGFLSVKPGVTTTYTITATNGAGSSTASVTVRVT